MEKRWHQRIPVDISVEIQHNGNRIGKCMVKDISLCGICLNGGPLAFYKNVQLTIKFPDSRYVYGNISKVNAIVVRNSRHEIGLMFNPIEPELVNSIIRQTKAAELESAFAYRM